MQEYRMTLAAPICVECVSKGPLDGDDEMDGTGADDRAVVGVPVGEQAARAREQATALSTAIRRIMSDSPSQVRRSPCGVAGTGRRLHDERSALAAAHQGSGRGREGREDERQLTGEE
jgi:hypothetical protein